MTYYKRQEHDFIKRTLKIIKQYNKAIKGKNNYNITLLMNCFVGLLILPQQYRYNSISEEEITKEKWAIDQSKIKLSKKDKHEKHEKGLNTILRHIRNSISHYRFQFEETSDEISNIKFEDYKNSSKKEKTFDATFTVKEIKRFTDKFTSYILKEMKTEKEKNK